MAGKAWIRMKSVSYSYSETVPLIISFQSLNANLFRITPKAFENPK
jgi:hypothetical protein